MNGERPTEPVLFLKPSTSVTGPDDAIKYPVKITERVDFEGELAVIIGRLCRGVPRERADEVIFGYTCANDVTARDLLVRDGQWTRAKGFDTFCPLGPWIETGTNSADLELTTTVNGAVRQQARTSELLWDVPSLIAYVSQVMTLLPGDVLLTGTPAGVGPLTDGRRGLGHHREHRHADQPGGHRRLTLAKVFPQLVQGQVEPGHASSTPANAHVSRGLAKAPGSSHTISL